MAFMSNKSKKVEKDSMEEKVEEKVLDVDASMQGKICFKDPVNLKINGEFQGDLDTRGKLIVTENAVINAEIRGESVEVSGEVNGTIIVTQRLHLKSTANVTGDVKTPIFSVEAGAVFNGKCEIQQKKTQKQFKNEEGINKSDFISSNLMDIKQLSEYIDIDEKSILKLIDEEKIPAQRKENNWRFNKTEIDKWISAS